MTTQEIVRANNFISIATKISKNHPFVFLPDFVDDFVNGMKSTKIIKKYNFRVYQDFHQLTTNLLRFKGKRSKESHIDNKQINLENSEWQGRYDLYMIQSKLFYELLVKLYNCNILKVFATKTILEMEYVSINELENQVILLYENLKKNIQIFSNKIRQNSFENYIKTDLNKKLYGIVIQLKEEGHITSRDDDVSIPVKYSEMDKVIYKILDDAKDGITHDSFRSKVLKNFPIFKIIASLGSFEEILVKFENNNTIIRKRAFWKYSPYTDQLFTRENYENIVENAKKQQILTGKTKFFGRKITPDTFIAELGALSVGDFDDLDDQVTRIAGLVLSDAAFLQSPREEMSDFDFIIDITNYNFKPEQEEMMKKFDLHFTSTIIHCKVMIGDRISTYTLSELEEIIPDGEQGIIFTCQPVAPSTKQHIENNKTIQIIDRDGIYDWCMINPVIPCRSGAPAKVMYGDNRGKIVMVKSLNYESGLAMVLIIPNNDEITVPIGSLEEIDLHISDPSQFSTAANNYFKFLDLLAYVSPDKFEEGLNTRIIDVEKKFEESIWTVKFDNVDVKIDLTKNVPSSFRCTCGHWLNQEHVLTLCAHRLAAIDHIMRIYTDDQGDFSSIVTTLNKRLDQMIHKNTKNAIDAIYHSVDSETKNLIKKYIKAQIS